MKHLKPIKNIVLIQLRSSRDSVVYHQKVQAFMSVLLVYSRDQHTTGIDAHHLSRRQVGDGDASLANQLFRLVVVVDSA